MAKSLEPQIYILPGEYTGSWSAYYVKVQFRNGNWSDEFKVDEGVRGINCKCKVTIDNKGNAYVDG